MSTTEIPTSSLGAPSKSAGSGRTAHWLLSVDAGFSRETGLAVPALCGRWSTPKPLTPLAPGESRRWCEACADIVARDWS